MMDHQATVGLKDLGWLNSASQELFDAVCSCDNLGHVREERSHSPSACRTTVTCKQCGFFYKIDSSG